ncbi:hypothetical protein ACTXT7_000144 [Hymenolepis weldensis]
MTMPHPTLQEQPKISLKNLAGKSCITHHILPIFSCTNRFSSFQKLTESFYGTKIYFKRRGGNEATCMADSQLNLLGFDWFGQLDPSNLPIATICIRVYSATSAIIHGKDNSPMFLRVFQKGLGLCNHSTASLKLTPIDQPNFRPKFH